MNKTSDFLPIRLFPHRKVGRTANLLEGYEWYVLHTCGHWTPLDANYCVWGCGPIRDGCFQCGDGLGERHWCVR